MHECTPDVQSWAAVVVELVGGKERRSRPHELRLVHSVQDDADHLAAKATARPQRPIRLPVLVLQCEVAVVKHSLFDTAPDVVDQLFEQQLVLHAHGTDAVHHV
jgi:hypothetical protein